jgi:Tfp pilus assembly major pilin PilA
MRICEGPGVLIIFLAAMSWAKSAIKQNKLSLVRSQQVSALSRTEYHTLPRNHMQSATDTKFQAKKQKQNGALPTFSKTAATAYYNGTDTTRSSAKA